MNSKVEMWVMANAKYFPPERIYLLQEAMAKVPESKLNAFFASMQLKDPTTILLLSIFLGSFGVDRFVNGDIGLGFGKLCTIGGFGIWWLIDIFFVPNSAKEKNFIAIMQAIYHFSQEQIEAPNQV